MKYKRILSFPAGRNDKNQCRKVKAFSEGKKTHVLSSGVVSSAAGSAEFSSF